MIKIKRSLSGIFFRVQNEETKKWESICFEDLSDSQQEEILDEKPEQFVRDLSKLLAITINEIGDELDLSKE